MKWRMKRKIDGITITVDESAKTDFQKLMYWNDDDFEKYMEIIE